MHVIYRRKYIILILMLTKTGQMLMRRKNQKNEVAQQRVTSIKQDSPQIKIVSQTKPQRKANHISHVTHVNYNKSTHQLQVSKQVLKQLQIQNFRLIEQNMKLVQWSKSFLLRTKQKIMRTIQGIQQFRYLQSVNKLYELIGELTEYQQTGFHVPKFSNKQHYLHLKRLNNPQSKNIIPVELQMRNLINFVYNPNENQPKPAIVQKLEEERQVLTPNFINLKVRPDYSEYEPIEGQQHLFNLLLLQGLCIQSFIEQNMR